MENNENNYRYETKENYSSINKEKVLEAQKKNARQQKSIFYSVDLYYYEYYDEYYKKKRGIYYIIIPKDYLENKEQLVKEKNDIFSKGKILRFSSGNILSFDAVVESSEEDPDKKNIVYAYLIPIKEKYRAYNKNLIKKYIVKERSGDLTYERMSDAIDAFLGENCCSQNLENYILGNPVNNAYKKFNKIFNYSIPYFNAINNFASFTQRQESEIQKIFYQEISTINLSKNSDNNIICLIINMIYQCRRNKKDKILICSSSNLVADSISLDLLRMNEYIINKLNILRIYAKNQEIIKRNKKLNQISFHKLLKKKYRRRFNDRRQKKKWLVNKNDIIISTCVNSYNDDIINNKFPFVIIIDANNSNENENLIPITLNAKHVLLISYEGSDNGEINLYKRIKYLYPKNHCEI